MAHAAGVWVFGLYIATGCVGCHSQAGGMEGTRETSGAHIHSHHGRRDVASSNYALRQYVVRPLVEADFVRFNHYAHRVKRILVPSDCPQFSSRIRKHIFDASVLDAFAIYTARRPDSCPLLPNLSVLHISLGRLDCLPTLCRSLPIFFGPQLRNIYCLTQQGESAKDAIQDYEIMMQKLVAAAPKLLYFSFHSYPWYIRTASAISTSICQLHHLISVRTDPVSISWEALLHLAKLPSLKIIDVKLPDSVDDGMLAPFRDPSAKCFLNLRYLRLVHQTGMPILTTVFRAVRSPYLHTIQIEVNNFDLPLLDLKDAIHAIGSRPGKRRIKSVTLKAMDVQGTDADPVIGEDVLEPLYALPNLTDLNLNISGPFAVTDDMLQTMALSWPKIMSLELGNGMLRSHPGEKCLASFVGLIILALKCPALHTLRVPFDPSPSLLPDSLHRMRPGLGAVHHNMRTLKVGRSKIYDTMGAASILSDVFPQLVDIECDWPWEEEAWENEEFLTEAARAEILALSRYRTRWNEVSSELFPHFARVREQERNWADEHGLSIVPVYTIDV